MGASDAPGHSAGQRPYRSSPPKSWNPWHGIYLALTDPRVTVPDVAERSKLLQVSADTKGIWPSRLLHIDTMTSYEQTPGNRYNGVKEPAFTILSYKWGLWVRDGQSSLEIDGIDWPMPAIDPAYFSMDEMSNVLEKMGEYAEWTWIDVACVNQYLTEQTMRDIVIEPRNFRLAQQTFAWWVDFTSDILEQLLNEVAETEAKLSAAMANSDEKNDLETIPSMLIELYDPLATLIGTPWFSSNWTLREIVLCKDIVILNREGDRVPLRHDDEKYANIDMIARACAAILTWLDQMEEHIAKDETVRIRSVAVPASIASTSDMRSVSNLGDLVEKHLDLVRAKGPFFLYATKPDILYHWTMVLLKTGRLVMDDQAGEFPHSEGCDQSMYGGWGGGFSIGCDCYSACACVGEARHSPGECPSGNPSSRNTPWNTAPWCIPCVLGISYPMVHGDPPITVHTQIPHALASKADRTLLGTPLARIEPDEAVSGGSSVTIEQAREALRSLETHLNA